MPVGCVKVKKGPVEERKIEGSDEVILGDIFVVIPVDKIILETDTIREKGEEQDKKSVNMSNVPRIARRMNN